MLEKDQKYNENKLEDAKNCVHCLEEKRENHNECTM